MAIGAAGGLEFPLAHGCDRRLHERRVRGRYGGGIAHVTDFMLNFFGEAELFKKLCTFVWDIFGLIPLIYDCQASIYNDAGINFNTLQHLELAGLIKFGNIGEFKIQKLKQEVIAAYYRQPYRIKFLLPEDNDFAIGSVILTEPGKQLALVCGSTPNSAFRDYILDRWKGLDVSPA